MNVKNFLTLAALVNLAYGLAFWLAPQGSADLYGYGAVTTPLSLLVIQFMGMSLVAGGVLCWMARGAEQSVGRTAVLWYLAVAELLFLYMNLRTMMGGEEGSMNYVDLAANAIFGFGALYFIMQDRKVA